MNQNAIFPRMPAEIHLHPHALFEAGEADACRHAVKADFAQEQGQRFTDECGDEPSDEQNDEKANQPRNEGEHEI